MAGIYGMNFKHMPELTWEYGYFIALGVMGLHAGAMYFGLRKRVGFNYLCIGLLSITHIKTIV